MANKRLTEEEIAHKVETDENFVNLPRYGYSLPRVMEAYPDGCPDHIIADALCMTEEEVATVYANILQRFREVMLDPEEHQAILDR